MIPRLAARAAVILAVFGSSVAVAAAPASAAPYGIRNYIAIGDSYSSGEGLSPYLRGTNTGTNTCHRSGKSYPMLVADRLGRGTRTVFRACSGARIGALDTVFKSEAPQFNVLTADADLVSVSIGGNDAEWADVIRACMQIHNGGVDKPTLYTGSDSCEPLLAGGPALIETITNRLYATYKEIRRKSPAAKIRIQTYPPIFPDRGDTTKACELAKRFGFSFALSADRERRMMLLQQRLNAAIVLAADRIRTDFELGDVYPIDTTAAWGGYRYGHTIDCGDSGRAKPWVNALRTDNWPKAPSRGSIKDWWLANAKEVFFQAPSSFHPTEAGQKVMADELYRSLARTAPVTPLRILTSALPAASAGKFYTAKLEAKGGSLPYQWSLAQGTLPAGLSLGSDGAITGVPSAPGQSSTFTAVVRDNKFVVASRQFTLATAGSSPTSVLVKKEMDAQVVDAAGEQFFTTQYAIGYRSGQVRLTGSSDGAEAFAVDDVVEVTVQRPDGTESRTSHDFSGGCGNLTSTQVDLTTLLQPGTNTVSLVLRDKCGDSVGNSNVYLNADDATLSWFTGT